MRLCGDEDAGNICLTESQGARRCLREIRRHRRHSTSRLSQYCHTPAPVSDTCCFNREGLIDFLSLNTQASPLHFSMELAMLFSNEGGVEMTEGRACSQDSASGHESRVPHADITT